MEVVLGLGAFLYSQRLHAGCALGANVPGSGFVPIEAFVTAYVNVFGREDFHHFREHALKEFKHLFVAGAEDVLCNAPLGPHFIWPAGAAKLRVCGQRRYHVAGEVDLWDYGYTAFGGVVDYFFHLFLGVEAAVSYSVAAAPVLAHHGAASPGTNLRQARIALDLHPPALVLREVPVEAVQLVCGHYVQVTLCLFYAPEMAARVKVHSAVLEARAVEDAHVGEYPIGLGLFPAVNGGRQHLLQSLARVHESV